MALVPLAFSTLSPFFFEEDAGEKIILSHLTAMIQVCDEANSAYQSRAYDLHYQLEAIEPFTTYTPDHDARQIPHFNLISWIVDQNIDINAPLEGGQTLLHFAVKTNHLPTVQLLLDKGADVNALDEEERSVLEYAAKHYHAQYGTFIIELLLNSGADAEAKNRYGDTYADTLDARIVVIPNLLHPTLIPPRKSQGSITMEALPSDFCVLGPIQSPKSSSLPYAVLEQRRKEAEAGGRMMTFSDVYRLEQIQMHGTCWDPQYAHVIPQLFIPEGSAPQTPAAPLNQALSSFTAQTKTAEQVASNIHQRSFHPPIGEDSENLAPDSSKPSPTRRRLDS